jgi:regulator of replication initiation timing
MSKPEQKKGIENYNNEGKSETKKRAEEKANVSKKKSESKKKKITTVYNSENLNANIIENEEAKEIRSNADSDVSKVNEDIKTQDAKIESGTQETKLDAVESKKSDTIENYGIDEKNSSITSQVTTELESEKKEQGVQKDTKEKKEKRPSNISISNKSELFKQIIDIALSCEKIESDKKKLKEKIKVLLDENATLKDERDSLKGNLEATELLCNSKQQEIDNLKSDIAHRDTVIGIVKADKDEAAQEFKNALAASLRTFMVDYKELASMEMSADVGYALAETLEGVFKILAKNGITVENQ